MGLISRLQCTASFQVSSLDNAFFQSSMGKGELDDTALVEMVVAAVESIGLGLKILSVWLGDNRVWRLISFVMSPSKGMKSMH